MLFLIFKGKHNSIVCKKLQKLDVMKNITTNENSWITKELFLEYIENALDYGSYMSFHPTLYEISSHLYEKYIPILL